MALARTRAVALVGVDGHVVDVEADITAGLPGLHLVGLPDTALREARDRVRAAIVNSGEAWPRQRITVSLSPASLPKRGSGFDLAVTMAVLAAAGAVPAAELVDMVFLSELGLDGRLRPVRGILPAVLGAQAAGLERIVVARENAAEAGLVPDVAVIPVGSLPELLARLRGQPFPDQTEAASNAESASAPRTAARAYVRRRDLDLADVAGQPIARKAVEVCAAGGHHLWLLGPPGSGKTMLAERLPTVLPPLDDAAALEVTAIHSVAGTLPPDQPLITEPPFCDPHHTATRAAMVGGGSGLIRPGAASLAHRGVLFIDEAPEFARGVLDALRQPLESGEVVIARAAVVARFPARFTLVMAANPCPCSGAGSEGDTCACTPHMKRRYLGRLSGPLLDRVDLKICMDPPTRAELLADQRLAEPSAVVAARVAAARERARARLAGTPWRTNAEVPGRRLRGDLAPGADALRCLEAPFRRGQLSARGVDRVIRVAWTLADLAGKPRPTAEETGCALALWMGVAR